MKRAPELHLIFITTKGGNYKALWKGKKLKDWTCPSDAEPGDVALFYLGQHPQNGLHAVARVASEPSLGDKAADWGAKPKGKAYFADYSELRRFERPIPLATIKTSFPRWERWKFLMGVRVHTVPPEFRSALSDLVITSNPWAKRYLAPWRGSGRGQAASRAGSASEPTEDLRYEGAAITVQQVRYERDSGNREQALAHAKPPLTCVVCGFNFGRAYGDIGRGFIEVHHVVPVSAGRRKPRDGELQLLCSNCHSMAHWKSGARPRSIKQLRAAWRHHPRTT